MHLQGRLYVFGDGIHRTFTPKTMGKETTSHYAFFCVMTPCTLADVYPYLAGLQNSVHLSNVYLTTLSSQTCTGCAHGYLDVSEIAFAF